MHRTVDPREFLKLAWRAGTLLYVCIMMVLLLQGLALGRMPISWLAALLVYLLSIALFIVGPPLMWMFFRLLIVVSSWSPRGKPSP